MLHEKPGKSHLQDMKGVNFNLLNKGIVVGAYEPDVLRKARSEQKSSKRLVKGCDMHAALECKLKFPSYVQKVGSPLEVHLFSKNQVNVLKNLILLSILIVLHLDATGSIVRNLNCHPHGDKGILFYGGVIKVGKCIIPMMELISSKHDADTITYFLTCYKKFLIAHNITWPGIS
jgi:hypothetical protein